MHLEKRRRGLSPYKILTCKFQKQHRESPAASHCAGTRRLRRSAPRRLTPSSNAVSISPIAETTIPQTTLSKNQFPHELTIHSEMNKTTNRGDDQGGKSGEDNPTAMRNQAPHPSKSAGHSHRLREDSNVGVIGEAPPSTAGENRPEKTEQPPEPLEQLAAAAARRTRGRRSTRRKSGGYG